MASNFRKSAKPLLGAILLFLAIALAVKFLVVDWFTIPQNGMFPSLPAHSHFFCRRYPYRDASYVRRGDIVVFRQFIKGQPHQFDLCVVGLPGDRVETKGNDVIINHVPLRHEQIGTYAGGILCREHNGRASYTVAFESKPARAMPHVSVDLLPTQFFVLGDNRNEAMDSRDTGPVDFSTIIVEALRTTIARLPDAGVCRSRTNWSRSATPLSEIPAMKTLDYCSVPTKRRMWPRTAIVGAILSAVCAMVVSGSHSGWHRR